MHQHLAEEDPVVIGWLTRVTIVLALLGVLVFDSSALLVGRVSVADHADTAAQAAADSWHAQHSEAAALVAAEQSAGSDEVVPDSLQIASDGATTLQLHRTVSTMVVRHLPQRLRQLASVTETGDARPPLNRSDFSGRTAVAREGTCHHRAVPT